MKRALLAVLALAWVALPHVTNAAVTPFTFLNGFNGANERPPNNSTNGTFTINTLDFDDSIGSFGRLTVNVSYSGLQGTANNAHIHGYVDTSTNAGVIQGLSHTGGTSGTISGMWDLPSTTARNNLFNGLTYLNLHSTVYGGGEWRGQLIPVPEPGVAALAALGAVGLWLLRRRRG